MLSGFRDQDGQVTTSWNDFETDQPELSETVRTRFGAYRHHVLATLRADGSPRVAGIEATFSLGELWLGGMPGAYKSRDLRRDPRFALHANPGVDHTTMDGGDVKIGGRAIWVDDPDTRARFAEAIAPPEPFDLFRVDLTEVIRTTVDGDDLVVQSWRPGFPAVRVQRRGNDDSPAWQA